MTALRPALPSDAAGILAIYRPIVESTAISFEVVCPSEAIMADRLTDPDCPWLVGMDATGIAGYAYASRHRSRAAYRWAVEVSLYVGESYRRSGVGSRLYRTLLGILALQGFRNALAVITLPNEASVRLHESLGFERVATYRGIGYKLGRWRDVGWWQLAIGPRDAEPQPPRSWETVRNSPEVAELLAREAPLLPPWSDEGGARQP